MADQSHGSTRASLQRSQHSRDQATLANLLYSKGVPTELTRERATQVIDKLGLHTVQQALASKNSWQKLKAEANRPNIAFRMILPHELTQHIGEQATSKFGINIAKDKKHKNKASKPTTKPISTDPDSLELFPGDFVTADNKDPVPIISLEAVVADAKGIALCTPTQAMPYIQAGRSIPSEALALALTEIPEDLPSNVKVQKSLIPAKYKGTDEPILLYGGLHQLGDIAVTRAEATVMPNPDVVNTTVLRIQTYRDLWQGDWQQFSKAPIREIVQWLPALRCCRDESCAQLPTCQYTHPAVDEEFTQVIFDLWARSFTSAVGKRSSPENSDSFAVFIRVPSSAVTSILEQQPRGVFIEPRAADTKGPDPQFKIIWLPGATYDTATHQLKLCPKGLCLMRLKQRFGIRVATKDEEASFRHLRPGVTYENVDVKTVYRLYPLPHGTQRCAIVQLLREWGWSARPLQPGRGDASHMAWQVGASTPPSKSVMPGFKTDILITEVRGTRQESTTPNILATRRTQEHIRRGTQHTKNTTDPWQDPNHDPWQHFKTTTSGPSNPHTAPPSKRYDELAKDIQAEVTKTLKQEVAAIQEQTTSSQQEARFCALETGVAELKAQNNQFSHWFAEMGQKYNELHGSVGELKQCSNQQQQTMQALRQDMSNQQTQLQDAMKATFAGLKDDLSSDIKSRFDDCATLLGNSAKRPKHEGANMEH